MYNVCVLVTFTQMVTRAESSSPAAAAATNPALRYHLDLHGRRTLRPASLSRYATRYHIVTRLYRLLAELALALQETQRAAVAAARRYPTER